MITRSINVRKAILRSTRPKGGTLCPPSRISKYFSADCYEIWHRCKTSHILKDSTIKISQGHPVGAHFDKK